MTAISMDALRLKAFPAVRPPPGSRPPSAPSSYSFPRRPSKTPLSRRTTKEKISGGKGPHGGKASPHFEDNIFITSGNPKSTAQSSQDAARGRAAKSAVVRGRDTSRTPSGSPPHSTERRPASARESGSGGSGMLERGVSSARGNPTFSLDFTPKDSIGPQNAQQLLASLDAPCPIEYPGCRWRTLAHYLLEDLQWLQRESNEKQNAEANEHILSNQVEKLKMRISFLETENEFVKTDHTADRNHKEDMIGQLTEQNKELTGKLETFTEDYRILQNQSLQVKVENEVMLASSAKAQEEWTEEKNQYQKLVARLRKEFENAVRTVELLMDDKHKMLNMLDIKSRKKKLPRRGKSKRSKGRSKSPSPVKGRGRR